MSSYTYQAPSTEHHQLPRQATHNTTKDHVHHVEPHCTPPTTSSTRTNSSQHLHSTPPLTQSTKLTSPHSHPVFIIPLTHHPPHSNGKSIQDAKTNFPCLSTPPNPYLTL